MAQVELKVSKSIFNEVYLPYIEQNDKRYEVYYGGAGSGKSVFVVQKILWNIWQDKGRNFLVVRKVARTNRGSTFALFLQTIGKWNLERYFYINKSSMTITCVNGNQIVFLGLDNVDKLKSITFDNGDLTNIWAEEANEMTEEDFEVLDLRLRGSSQHSFQFFLTFNPVSVYSWLKSYFFDRILADSFTLKTTYKDNKFIDANYAKKIDALKLRNNTLYEIYGLGNWGALGNLIYTHYKVETFDVYETNDTGKRTYLFNNKYVGQDWGFTEPSATIVGAIKDDKIYLFDELYLSELTNPQLMKAVEKVIDKSQDRIIADSSEPARIKEWRDSGWRIQGAKKEKDSVLHGINWLQAHEIIVHPNCVNWIKEAQAYSFEKDKDGKVLDEPVDFMNHLMDATRYAFEKAIRQRNIKYLQ